MTAKSFLLAAESARLEGQIGKSIDILKAAYKQYPDSSVVLNNLVYSLSRSRDTISEALSLLPELENLNDKTFHVYDTMAMVNLEAGRLEEARKYIDKALEVLKADGYSASEVKLNAARIFIRQGALEAAKQQIEAVRSDTKRSELIERESRALLEEIRELSKDKK